MLTPVLTSFNARPPVPAFYLPVIVIIIFVKLESRNGNIPINTTIPIEIRVFVTIICTLKILTYTLQMKPQNVN